MVNSTKVFFSNITWKTVVTGEGSCKLQYGCNTLKIALETKQKTIKQIVKTQSI